MKELKQFGIIPIDYNVLSNLLINHRSPKDKISRLEKKGDIIRLKKGLYIVSPEISQQKVSRELIANHLYGPSYISLESALAFYGLIPEKVFTVRSVSTKRAKSFHNSLGNFDYVSMPEAYYAIGIRQEIFKNEYAYLIASPEKAICDLILSKNNFRIQSLKAMKTYLEEDLRIDLSAIKTYDKTVIQECIELGRKKNELKLLLKILEL